MNASFETLPNYSIMNHQANQRIIIQTFTTSQNTPPPANLSQIMKRDLKVMSRVYEWLWTGFGSVIGFIDHLKIVTISTVTLSLIHKLYSWLEHALSLLSLLSSQSLLASDFQRRTVPDISPCLSSKFLTATAHSDWTAAVLWLTAHQPTRFTPLFSLSSVGRVIWPRSGPPENATSNISSIVARHHRVLDAFLCCVCMGHYLATSLHSAISLVYNGL
jgi:hypothetical protein